jgi:hypothetical protein
VKEPSSCDGPDGWFQMWPSMSGEQARGAERAQWDALRRLRLSDCAVTVAADSPARAGPTGSRLRLPRLRAEDPQPQAEAGKDTSMAPAYEEALFCAFVVANARQWWALACS